MRGFRFLRLDGQTPVAKRQSLVDRFNSNWGGEEQETVFLLSSKAGGVGLNLIGRPDCGRVTDSDSYAWDGTVSIQYNYQIRSDASVLS